MSLVIVLMSQVLNNQQHKSTSTKGKMTTPLHVRLTTGQPNMSLPHAFFLSQSMHVRIQALPDVNSNEVFSWPSPVVYLAVMKDGAWPHTWALP